MINQALLKTFCTLVNVGHFTQTAEKLFMTQSGVSQHIKKLEKQLDSQLLIREGKTFSLTAAGHQLHQKGLELLRSSDELEALIRQDKAYVGRVKIASPGSVGLKLYSHLLDLQQQHPELVIDYRFAPNKAIQQELADRTLDLALITELTNNSSLLSEKVAEEPLVLITSNKVKSVNWQTLIELGFISHPDAEHHGRQLLSMNFAEFEHVEQFPCKGFSNQISLILDPVSRGFGFTVLPWFAVKAYQHQNSIKIHKLQTSVSEDLYLCVNRHSTLSNRSKFIKSVLTDYLR
ncbi:LysR family transcriptional regulator [Paraglaciecola sp. MB-3u-78]|uniref:LysR family transcriptional regulator n=1 Tax=Paraglaciecola sp. MB-3u-78 TaxID=2058332 RepID=UPI000C321AA1|nr:LysR family transcriptional regulator [Paraglaciecola sp. MB-3u-78]PKG99122.1 LysR family transcriptional regulator [Paraglaciecola sp. MB-3u-78]